MPRTSDWREFLDAQPGPPAYAAPGWALICIFIIYGSVGPFAADGASPWGPFYVSFADVLQNILLYLPFGCFGMLALDNRRHSFRWRAIEVAAFACGLSLIAETAQLFIVNRTASVSDVLAGTFGAALGAVLAPAVARFADGGCERARRLGIAGSALAVPLVTTLAALAIVAWWPFDITLDPATVSRRVNTFREEPWRSGDAIELASQALRYALATLLIAISLERLHVRTAAVAAMLGGLVFAIVLDAGQLIMGGTPAGGAYLQYQAGGCLVGGALFVLSRDAERHPAA